MLSYKKFYHKLINKKEIQIFRLAMVHDALKKGIGKRAKYYEVNKNTISKGVKRFKDGENLKDHCKSPLTSLHSNQNIMRIK